MISIPFETQKTKISQKNQKISFLPQISQKSKNFSLSLKFIPAQTQTNRPTPKIPKNPKKFEISQPRFLPCLPHTSANKKARTSRASLLHYLIQTLSISIFTSLLLSFKTLKNNKRFSALASGILT